MGETHEVSTNLVEKERLDMELTCVRKERRNGMWNIFEGMDAEVLQKLSGLSIEMVQQLISDTVTELDGTFSDCLPQLINNHSDSSSTSSASSLFVSSGNPCQCQRSRMDRSFSATVDDELKVMVQNRQRRNAVGNLFDVLTPSQKLLLVEHLQQQMERLRALHADANNSDKSQVILTLSDLSSSSSSSSSGGSSMSSARSQGEIVCR